MAASEGQVLPAACIFDLRLQEFIQLLLSGADFLIDQLHPGDQGPDMQDSSLGDSRRPDGRRHPRGQLRLGQENSSARSRLISAQRNASPKPYVWRA